MNGIERIIQERKEQVEKHSHTTEADSQHYDEGQLLQMAEQMLQDDCGQWHIPDNWNVADYNYMMAKPILEKLAIAGALIAAHIDLILFKKAKEVNTEESSDSI